MPKKVKEKAVKPIEVHVPSEKEQLTERQAYLLSLRNMLVTENIRDLGQLDVVLSQVNQRLEVLSNG